MFFQIALFFNLKSLFCLEENAKSSDILRAKYSQLFVNIDEKGVTNNWKTQSNKFWIGIMV
jgi:hypothetical protein